MITLDLPFESPPVLAVGAFLKNAVAGAKGRRLWLDEAQGDLDNPGSIRRFRDAVRAMRERLGGDPLRIAHDLHPDFPSTRHALGLGWPTLAVQHHHAHIAALAAEHSQVGPLLGLALDGFGLGPGNQSWGGELLRIEGGRFERLGHLKELAQPGGDVAARQPWRMAAAVLFALGRGGEIAACFAEQPAAARLGEMLTKGINCPLTSSAGRLFDAAAGLVGLHPVAEFEGQAPMALEARVDAPAILTDGWRIEPEGILDVRPLLARLAELDAVAGANLFHGTLAAGLVEWAGRAAQASGIGTIALGGGCFLNRVLTKLVTAGLMELGLTPLIARRLSPGDAGLAAGQAWVAARVDE